MAFNHENLNVYQRLLPFNVKVGLWTGEWDNKHAICDQLSRAAASILENVAMASAAYSSMKHRALDYAIGSSLECAACLDLARIKRLLEVKRVYAEKEELSQILRMLVGLRKSWAACAGVVKEEWAEYGTGLGGEEGCDKEGKVMPLFHHETLDVYRVGLEAATALCASDAVSRLPKQAFRRLDELLTSMILNIAEGNGRFSDADQARFLGTSHESAIKLAARLDLCVTQNLIHQDEVGGWKTLLQRVSVMTASMIAGIQR